MTSSGYYARALRVIGQEVSKLRPVMLDIEMTGDTFVVRGTCAENAQHSFCGDEANTLEDWLNQLEQNPDEELDGSSGKGFELRYSRQDIDMLDQEWARLRGSVNKKPELWSFPKIWSLSELLRTAGRYIDSAGGRLKKITREKDRVVLRVQDDKGDVKALECSLMDLCRIQARMVSKRALFEFKHMKTVWGKYDLKI